MAAHNAHLNRNGGMLDPTCERCIEQAEDPRGLDYVNIHQAWQSMLTVEFFGRAVYRNDADRLLGLRLYEMAVILERLGTDPREVGGST